MKRIFLITLFSLFFSACTNNTLNNIHNYAPTDTRPWPSYGYKGYSEGINNKAGADSLNCGFFDLIIEKNPTEKLKKAKECVQYAIDNTHPFRFGTRYIPEDSYLFKSVLLSPENEYWIVMFDIMLGGDSETQLFIKRCESIEIFTEENDIYFIENNCTGEPSL